MFVFNLKLEINQDFKELECAGKLFNQPQTFNSARYSQCDLFQTSCLQLEEVL